MNIQSVPEPKIFSNTRTRSVPKLKTATRWSLVLTDVIFGVESFGGGKPTSKFWSLDSGWGRTLLFMWWLLLTSVLHFKGHCCKVYQRCVRGGRKVPLEFSKLLLSLSLLCNVNPWKVARGPRCLWNWICNSLLVIRFVFRYSQIFLSSTRCFWNGICNSLLVIQFVVL